MKSLPQIRKFNKKYMLFIDDKPFIMFAAELHNSAASSAEYMKIAWEKIKELNCNTLLVPVYWNLIEKKENKFDFTDVKRMISDAREYKIKLVLLWFGSWKNGLSGYAPGWVKMDWKRFPRVENEYGVKTKILSMFQSDILSVELNAFKSFMEYIKEVDEKEHTVIAVQVENEVGILGSVRDFSNGANEAYRENVSDNLTEYLKKQNFLCFRDMIYKGDTAIGTWEDVFGRYAPEAFMCANYAAYIEKLAKQGKEIYNLPLFTNVWLKGNNDEKAGIYPCGGPVPEMIDIWKCTAPSLDFISPDIYSFEFEKAAALYAREDNPLFIPETRRDKWAVANLYTSVGKYNSLCYSPFGAESIGEDKSFITGILHTDINDKNISSEMVKRYLSKSYKMLCNMLPIITECYGTDNIKGFAQKEGEISRQLRLDKYLLTVEYYHNINENNEFIPGAGIVIQISEDELLFIGYGYKAELESLTVGKQLDFLFLEKGNYDENHKWIKYMDLNGDEQYIRMEEEPTLLRVFCYEF